jgi:hypothetical protein
MHKTRRKALNAVIMSLISGADLSVTSLGRNINSKTTEKHQIKRSDRLCSNPHLQMEMMDIYKSMAKKLIGNKKHPFILIDWSDLDDYKCHFLMRASIAIEGRSLTLYEEVHTLKTKEKPVTHRLFINQLKVILPPNITPIIISDAGFRVPWFKQIRALGWDYLGRIRNRTSCKNETDEDWHPVKDLYRSATSTPKEIGLYKMSKSTPFETQMVVYKGKSKGRKDLVVTGERARRSKQSRAYAKRNSEPWLLATSLKPRIRHAFAKKIVTIYKKRMQIEESFKDIKTGLNFNESLSKKPEKINALLLIALLAQYVLYLVGLAMEMLGKHTAYQSNSIKTRRVLSYQFLKTEGVRAFDFGVIA